MLFSLGHCQLQDQQALQGRLGQHALKTEHLAHP